MEYEIAWPIKYEDDFISRLEHGWKLYGNPFLDANGEIRQALIREN